MKAQVLEAREAVARPKVRKVVIRRVRPRARTPLFNRIPAAFPLLLLAVVAPPLILLPSRTPQASPPPHPKPAPRPQIERRIQAEGVDRHQHSAKFTIYVLSADLSWKLESVTDLEGNRPLLNPELHQAINRAQEVFCVGTASFEGATDSEERRAVRRAQTLAEWAGSAIEDRRKTHLYPVSAGQYRGPDSLTSSLQRKAIIIVTAPHEEGLNLAEALESGLRSKEKEDATVYNLLHYYSRSGQWWLIR